MTTTSARARWDRPRDERDGDSGGEGPRGQPGDARQLGGQGQARACKRLDPNKADPTRVKELEAEVAELRMKRDVLKRSMVSGSTRR